MLSKYDVKLVLSYYYDIPSRLKMLSQALNDLSEEYNRIHAAELDAMPKASEPGRPTEAAAARVDERGVYDAMHETVRKINRLRLDQTVIAACIDGLCGEYQRLFARRFRERLNWVQISVRRGVPERTARYWFTKATALFDEALSAREDADGILERAKQGRR